MLSGDFWPSVGVLTAGLALILNFCCFNDVQGHSSFKSQPEDLKAPFSQPIPLVIQSWLSFHARNLPLRSCYPRSQACLSVLHLPEARTQCFYFWPGLLCGEQQRRG